MRLTLGELARQTGARAAMTIVVAMEAGEDEAIAKGEAASRSCAVLVSGAEDLRFVRAGEHFLVFLDRPDEVIVVDILHSRSDLPRHVAALSALIDDEGRKDN